MKHITIIIALLLISKGQIVFSQKTFNSFSTELFKLQKKNDKSTFNLSKYFYQSRECLRKTLKTKELLDTLYLVEGYDIQSGEVVSTVWSKYWRYNYRYKNKKINIINTDNFSPELLKRTMNGIAGITNTKNFGSISGLATRMYFHTQKFTIFQQPFEE